MAGTDPGECASRVALPHVFPFGQERPTLDYALVPPCPLLSTTTLNPP
jgi:hypothetical protein